MMKTINRRLFFKSLGQKLFGGYFAFEFCLVSSKFKSFFSKENRDNAGIAVFVSRAPVKGAEKLSVLSILDINSTCVEEISIPLLLAHSVIQDPQNPDRLVILDKSSPYFCELDIRSRNVSRRFEIEGDLVLGGHGVFSPDGKKIYFPEFSLSTNIGSIAVRDSKNFKLLKRINSYGLTPHQMQFLDDPNILLVSNYGSYPVEKRSSINSSLVYINLEKGISEKKISFDDDNRNFPHFLIYDSNQVLVGVNDRIYKKGKLHFFSTPMMFISDDRNISFAKHKNIDHLQKHTFDICYSKQSAKLAVTHTHGNSVSFWRAKNRSLIRTHKFNGEQPWGVVASLDGEYFVVSTDKGNIYYFRTSNCEIDSKKFAKGLKITRRCHAFSCRVNV